MGSIPLGVVGKVQAGAEGVEWLKQRKAPPEIVRLIPQLEERPEIVNVVCGLLQQIAEDPGSGIN
jgi:hypothetical protein